MHKSYAKDSALFTRAAAAILGGIFFFTSTYGLSADRESSSFHVKYTGTFSNLCDANTLAIAAKTKNTDFKATFGALELCRLIEEGHALQSIPDIAAKLRNIEGGVANIRIRTVSPYEVICENPSEGSAVRYFDPAPEALDIHDPHFPREVTPYPDVVEIQTLNVSGHLHRQIIQRAATTPLEPERATENSEDKISEDTHRESSLPEGGGMSAGDLFDMQTVKQNAPLIRRIIAKNEEAITCGDKTYIIWTSGPKKGMIYQIIDVPSEWQIKNLHAQIKHIKAAIDSQLWKLIKLYFDAERKLKNESIVVEPWQRHPAWDQYYIELYRLYLYLHQIFYDNAESIGLERAQYYNDEIYGFVQDVREKGITNWIREKLKERGFNLIRVEDSIGIIDSYFGLETGYNENVFFDPEDPVVLTSGTDSRAFSNIIQLGGLASSCYLESAGIPKQSGENITVSGRSVDPRVVSFFYYPEGRVPLPAANRAHNHDFEEPIIFGISRRQAALAKIDLSEPLKNPDTGHAYSGYDEERVVHEFISLNHVTHLFVPYFTIAKYEKILREHGYSHIRVLPLTFEDNTPIKSYIHSSCGLQVPESKRPQRYTDISAQGTILTHAVPHLDASKTEFESILGENKPDVLLRVDFDYIESLDREHARNFLMAFQNAPNGYIELFSSIRRAKDAYEKLGLHKKPLPENFIQTRENTITLFRAFRGEDIGHHTGDAKMSLNFSATMSPEHTILLPVGFKLDTTGLIRTTVFGMKILAIARQMREGKNIDRDRINVEILHPFRSMCDPDDFEKFDVTSDDILALASGNINRIIPPLKKLIRLLPFSPIDTEELKRAYERMEEIIMAA